MKDEIRKQMNHNMFESIVKEVFVYKWRYVQSGLNKQSQFTWISF